MISERLTSKPLRDRRPSWATSEAAWKRRALNSHDHGSLSAFCKDVVLGDLRGRLSAVTLEVTCASVRARSQFAQNSFGKRLGLHRNWSRTGEGANTNGPEGVRIGLQLASEAAKLV